MAISRDLRPTGNTRTYLECGVLQDKRLSFCDTIMNGKEKERGLL
jgi:hypothetical protein